MIVMMMAIPHTAYSSSQSCSDLFAVREDQNSSISEEWTNPLNFLNDDLEFKDDLDSIERDALRIMNQLKLSDEAAEKSARTWVDALSARQSSGQALTVMEHTALQLVLRTGFFNEDTDPKIISDMKEIYVKSWHDLTAKVNDRKVHTNLTFENLVEEQLPDSVLKNEPLKIQKFHKLVYDVDRETLLVQDRFVGQRALSTAMPPIVALLGFAFMSTGSPELGRVVGAAALGFTVSCIGEYIFHAKVMHASKAKMEVWESKINQQWNGWFYKALLKMARSHYIHHAILRAERGQHTRLPPPRKVLDDMYRKTGAPENEQSIFENDTRNGVVMERGPYNNTVIGMSLIAFGLDLFIRHDPGSTAVIAAAFGGILAPHVDIMHSKMHLKRSEVDAQVEQAQNAVDNDKNFSSVMALKKIEFKRWFMQSFYFSTINRVHFMHHVHQNTNYGILPGNLDAVFRTQSRMEVEHAVSAYIQDVFM